MVVVGFDTATEDTAVCASDGAEVLYEALLGLGAGGGPQHSTALLGEVDRAAAAAGGWQEVESIVVGIGPGSFTGLRVGIATALALGASAGLRARGVCTLDALAVGLAEADERGSNRLAVLDARRNEVFAALYGPGGERLWEPFVSLPTELAERLAELPEPPLAGGSGALRFRDELAVHGVEIPDDAESVHRVAARHVCAVAAAGDAEGDGRLAPIYLRPPDAERWRERDTFQTSE